MAGGGARTHTIDRGEEDQNYKGANERRKREVLPGKTASEWVFERHRRRGERVLGGCRPLVYTAPVAPKLTNQSHAKVFRMNEKVPLETCS